MTTASFPVLSFAAVRERLIARDETALLDVREEDPFAQAHPLWAANLPLSRIEIEAWRRIPRRDTFIVLYGEHGGVDLAPLAAKTLAALGYTHVHLLEGGLEGWRGAGGELFRDVNVPSKSFGELVEHERHTPSLSAPEVQALIEGKKKGKANVVVLDARRFDEYQTMSIPSATSVPGAELVLRVRELAPDPATQVIVNCAGRTRSIIGTQSLVNAGIPNPVAALRNGTIGWKLAGQVLDHGAASRRPRPCPTHTARRRRPMRVAWPMQPACAASRSMRCKRWRRRGAPCTASTFARPRNTPQATCPALPARPAASWCRKPTTRCRCAARASCWRTTTACARR
jgi:rhodanese-related sulfurtransferase